jgi:hypothetical protein
MTEPARGRAHALLIGALPCWLGGVWSDAEGATEDERIGASEGRCHEFVKRLYGHDDQVAFERLRALDAGALSDLRDEIVTTAPADPRDAGRKDQLVQLLDAVTAAEREGMYARRAANIVKNDIAVPQPDKTRKADEDAAVEPLRQSKALEALLRLDAGDLNHEARALAYLGALDRMQTARALPTHLKFYAVGGAFSAVFGATPPEIPSDASEPVKGGIWLEYLKRVADAAGHPVPSEYTQTHRDEELLAWGGTFMGIADKLHAEAEQIADAAELKRVALAVARRLENEYQASQTAVRQTPHPGP